MNDSVVSVSVRFARADCGLSSLEYAMAVGVMVLAVSAGLSILGDEIQQAIETVAARVPVIVALVGG